MRADRQPCHGLESRGRRDGPELPDLYPEQVAWAARDDFDRLRKDLETRSIIVNYANNARQKRKAPPGGRRGFESLAGLGGWGRDPAKSDLQVSRWLIVPKISWRVRPATPPTIF